MNPAPARPELDELYRRARENPPSEEVLREQRVSFAYGNAPASATGITRESILDASRRIRMLP